jgi:hypothetical protein
MRAIVSRRLQVTSSQWLRPPAPLKSRRELKSCTKLCLLPRSPSDCSRRQCHNSYRPPPRNSRRARRTKMPSPKKIQALGRPQRATGRKNAAPNGRKPKPPARSKRERRGRNIGALATSALRPLQNNEHQSLFTRTQTSSRSLKRLRASARLEISPTPSKVIPNRGAAA